MGHPKNKGDRFYATAQRTMRTIMFTAVSTILNGRFDNEFY